MIRVFNDVYIRYLNQFEHENDPGRNAGETFWWKGEETSDGQRFQLS